MDRSGYVPLPVYSEEQAGAAGNNREPSQEARAALMLLRALGDADKLWVMLHLASSSPDLIRRASLEASAVEAARSLRSLLDFDDQPNGVKPLTDRLDFDDSSNGAHVAGLTGVKPLADRSEGPAASSSSYQSSSSSVWDRGPGREVPEVTSSKARELRRWRHEQESLSPRPLVELNEPADFDQDRILLKKRFDAQVRGLQGAIKSLETMVAEKEADRPLVQFSAFMYFCNEDEGAMRLDVMRVGDLSKPSAVSFRTRDLSAKSGVKFQGMDFRISFAPGDDSVEVEVPLLECAIWDTTLEFAVELYDGEEGLENAVLGRYLWSARVKIIDLDCFPSNKYEEFLRGSRDVQNAPPFGLFWDYVQFNWWMQVIRERARRVIVIDQLHNLYGFFHLFLNVYLVDYVLNPDCSDSSLILIDRLPKKLMDVISPKVASLFLVVLGLFLPFVLLYMLDYRKATSYGLGGNSRLRLQLALMRKFLNYDSESRARMRNSDLAMAMTRDSPILVAHGFQHIFKIMQELGQLLFMLAYQFIAPVVFGKKFSWLGFGPLVMFPVIMGIFLRFRNATTKKLLSARNDAQNRLVDAVNETMDSFRLIADYNQREAFVIRFETAIKGFNGANKHCNVNIKQNRYFAQWLVTICVVSWTVIGGLMVVGGSLSLGMFMANINIFSKIGASWGSIYDVFLEMLAMIPALESIVTAMNLKTDVSHRKALNRARRHATKGLRAQLRANPVPDQIPLDRMPIIVSNINFEYKTVGHSGSVRSTQLNQSGRCVVEQGKLVMLIGPSGGGKTTLLKLIGGEILPDAATISPEIDVCSSSSESQFFVPSHIRVLHVGAPVFFDGSLHDNLAFGCKKGDADERVERVVEICRKLGVDQEVLRHITNLEDRHVWSDCFSSTQCQILGVARAIIATPEVLCIHKPTQQFDNITATTVTQVLKEFVVSKGVLQLGLASMRRPRTCIVTTSDRGLFSFADKVFHASQNRGIVEVSPEDYETVDMTHIEQADADDVPMWKH